MSVGVCVINRNGIALAADSAGTYTNNQDEKKKMFYNSVEKLFSVSDKHICGAIAFGKLTLCNVAIDQILKEFKCFLDEQEEFLDLFDVISLFSQFIQKNNKYYGFDQEEASYCKEIIDSVISEWNEKTNGLEKEPDCAVKINEMLLAKQNEIARWNAADCDDISIYVDKQYREYFDNLITKNPTFADLSDQKELLWNVILLRPLNLNTNFNTRTVECTSGFCGKIVFSLCRDASEACA